MLQKLAPVSKTYSGKKFTFYLSILRKPAHFIFYFSSLQKPAPAAGFCNELKYKADTFYLSTIQKPAPV